jgi:hypothetical protein
MRGLRPAHPRKEKAMKGFRFALAGVLLLLMVWVKLEDMRKAE